MNYNYCVGHNGQHATGQHDQNGSPIIEPAIDNPSSINLIVYCGGIYASDNGTGITALATVLLTIVTGLVGKLAWEQGETTRAQLRAYMYGEITDIKSFLPPNDVAILIDWKTPDKRQLRISKHMVRYSSLKYRCPMTLISGLAIRLNRKV